VLGGLTYGIALFWPGRAIEPTHRALTPAGCDLRQGACVAIFPDGQTLSLDIEPKSLPSMQPLRLTVQISGFSAEDAEVEFNGLTMNMGVNKATLLDVGENRFAGDAILPVCVRRGMDWEARVTATGPEGVWQTSFFFETRRP
jgi:hypothetical protein